MTTDRMNTRATRWIFLRLIGLVYLIAFLSFWSQAMGLIGIDGISPAQNQLAMINELIQTNDRYSWHTWPTIFSFLGASDRIIHTVCASGVLCSLGLVMNVLPQVMALILWVTYLSLFTVARPFLGYQWDVLLLEVGFLAILYAPSQIKPFRPDQETEPPRWVTILLRFLLFKLILSSGLVKLNSADPSWQDLSALEYHFWTQPIPHPLSWYAHHMGQSMLHIGVFFNHFIELCVPWLVLFPLHKKILPYWLLMTLSILWINLGSLSSTTVILIGLLTLCAWVLPKGLDIYLNRLGDDGSHSRIFACMMIIVLMMMIGLSGNYGYFNLLTMVLALVCLDDGILAKFAPYSLKRFIPENSGSSLNRLSLSLTVLIVFLLMPFNIGKLLPLLGHDLTKDQHIENAVVQEPVLQNNHSTTWHEEFWKYVQSLNQKNRDLFGSYALVNGYGLFARMTKTRYELIIEGSDDQKEWKAYQFIYKPNHKQDLRFAGVHMPRIDWQMWFAALSPKCSRRWFFEFLYALFNRSASVHNLLAHNPFQEQAPKYLRVRKVRATFTTLDQNNLSTQSDQKLAAKWNLTPAGMYCPILDQPTLARFLKR